MKPARALVTTVIVGLLAVVYVFSWSAWDGTGRRAPTEAKEASVEARAARPTPAVREPGADGLQATRVPAFAASESYDILVKSGNKPVGGAEVLGIRGRLPSAGPALPMGVTDVDGHLVVPTSALGPEVRWLACSWPAFDCTPVEVQPGGGRVVLDLLARERVSVRCISLAGLPVQGVKVDMFQNWASRDERPHWPEDRRYSRLTDDQGLVAFDLPRATYCFDVFHEDLAWVPDDSFQFLEMTGAVSLTFTLITPVGLSVKVSDGDVAAHAVHMRGAAVHQQPGEKCRALAEARLKAANPNGIVALAIPDLVNPVTADVCIWVPGRGFGTHSSQMRPVNELHEVQSIRLDEFEWRAEPLGYVQFALSGPGAELARTASWSVMKRGGAVVPMFILEHGPEARVALPVGDYPVVVPSEPLLASYVRSKIGDLEVRHSEVAALDVDVPTLVRVTFRCVDHLSRPLSLAFLDIHGGGVRTRLQLPGAKGTWLCPQGQFTVYGQTGNGGRIPKQEVTVSDDPCEIVLTSIGQ